MRYTLIIHKDSQSCYGVSVAELPGCISAGETLDEAIASAEEAVDLHLIGMLEDGEALPDPIPVEKVAESEDAHGALCLMPLTIDGGKYQRGSEKINVTLPRFLIYRIDKIAGPRGRSAFLAEAAAARLEHR
jgi:predicted RNase H-like HicB family nuclease